MSRWIDVEWLEENAKEYSLGYYDYDEYAVPLSALDSAPTIDAVSVVHGEWMAKNSHTMYCSVCGFEEVAWRTQDYGYCPNCGTKMDGERKGE